MLQNLAQKISVNKNSLWQVQEKAESDFISQFPEYHSIVLQLLWARGIKTRKAINEFFNSDYDHDLHDPFLLKGMNEAVKRLAQAYKAKEKIGILSDYDVDGICSGSVLNGLLKKLNFDFLVYIPDRSSEGYGLNARAIDYFHKQKVNLIMTTDVGITNFKEIKMAKDLGMDVIVMDHHQISNQMPEAIVIDPYQKDDNYPFKGLSATGVVFKFLQAVIADFSPDVFNVEAGFEKWFLDLVVLATIADSMPLLGENRILCRYGFLVLAKTKRVGLKALFKFARIEPKIKDYNLENLLPGFDLRKSARMTNLNSQTISFVLAPRLNAASRMDHANIAFLLLNAESQEEAQRLAEKIETKNNERQDLVLKIMADIEARLKDKRPENFIFLGSPDYSIGVAGLIAGKLAEKHQKPAFIFEIKNDVALGSARSISGLNIVDVLKEMGFLFKKFGGHAMAAGFELDLNNLSEFEKKLEKSLKTKLVNTIQQKVILIDAEVSASDINWDFYKNLELFEPWGAGNPKPKFLIKDLVVEDLKMVGAGAQHLKLKLHDKSQNVPIIFDAIGFNLARDNNLKKNDHIDLVFELRADEFNGYANLALSIIDFKKSHE